MNQQVNGTNFDNAGVLMRKKSNNSQKVKENIVANNSCKACVNVNCVLRFRKRSQSPIWQLLFDFSL
ncbi:CLUMA_CG002980, isoform A [Clunio marinus]|uniref:CLUMA_CG002980, isoform A n=1 Tax=Clunio marinus TaxID=568069 RepID=A0A1J1HME9_9DIPT|nr:CLUMA_CG002980, isoform A [Clunio marinus]